MEPGNYNVLIKVNPFSRFPFGNPDPDESPPRHPNSVFEYKLWVLPEEQVNTADLGDHYLILSRITFKAGEWLIDNTYIPPSTAVNSHPSLVKYYRGFASCLSEIETSALTIIQKIIKKNQKTPLSENVKNLSERLAFYIGDIFFQYKTISYQLPPIFLIEYFVRLSNTMRLCLASIPEKEKEEMLNYFNEWSDLNPSAFEKTITNLTDMDYDHNNINLSFESISLFINPLAALFNKLSTLEFIGKHKEKDLFVRETRIDSDQADKKKKQPWRPMLD